MAEPEVKSVTFPPLGMHVTGEHAAQPPGTSPLGVNVRLFESLKGRARGGSRPGHSKLINETLNGVNAIQHMDVIVTTDIDYLGITDLPSGSLVELTGYPGVYVPDGGNGWQPNPNATQDSEASATLDIVQSFTDGVDGGGSEITVFFDTTPGNGKLMLVFVATHERSGQANNCTVTVTNGNLSAYTQVGGYIRNIHTADSSQFSLSCWKRVASEGAGEINVKVTPNQVATIRVGGMEWRGQDATPTDSTSTNSGTAAALTTGVLAIDDGTEAAVGAFVGVLTVDTVTPAAGYTLAINHTGGAVSDAIMMYVAYRKTAPVGNENPSVTWDGGADLFVAFGVELKD